MRGVTAESIGYDILGPIVAEFCLRLWQLTSLFERPSHTQMLFCARGGLRMQLAHEEFLTSTGLQSPMAMGPVMISRVAAVRPVLARTVREGLDCLLPAADGALAKEFGGRITVAAALKAVSGVDVPPAAADGAAGQPYAARPFLAVLRHPEGAAALEELLEQADLFSEHLRDVAGGAEHLLFVDTGLYGTTRDLVAQSGYDRFVTSCALFARSFRHGTARDHRTYGLSSTARSYTAVNRRSAVLRYWHFVEWLFEPSLPSVREFHRGTAGEVVSDLEVDGWQAQIVPAPGSAFAGVMAYLGDLGPASGATVVADADRAWSTLHRAIVVPTAEEGFALSVDTRSHGFGREKTWVQPEAERLWTTLRSRTMWREGQVARSRHPLGRPALVLVEAGYAARSLRDAVRSAVRGS